MSQQMPTQFCHACGMPFDTITKTNYCTYCVDESGNLKPKEEVQQGIAQWLSQWQPKAPEHVFLKRAESYMQAMPAWSQLV